MSGKTKIEWADRVWNPTTGCTKGSEGCRNCYAERLAGRFWGERKFSEVQCHPDRLDLPHHWRKPQRIFVDSMSDLFHPDVPDEFIWDVWNKMDHDWRHTFMILTKRPERMYQWAKYYVTELDCGEYPNIWLGVSVEDQKTADERIPLLLQTPAAVRFVSVEPMLGAVDMELAVRTNCGVYSYNSLTGENWPFTMRSQDDGEKLDWVICGGESGPGARPMHPDWARSLRDQCQAADVPFFFKSWGEWSSEYPQGVSMTNRERIFQGGMSVYRVGKKKAGRLLDGREWNEMPEVKDA